MTGFNRSEGFESKEISVGDVKAIVPSTLKPCITQTLVDKLNSISSDPLAAEDIKKNFISHANILQEGKFKLEDYMSAVAYVSYKLMGYTNEKAYTLTFPDRYKSLADNQKLGNISAYVSSYHKGKLVNLIMEQSLIPMWLVNTSAYQEAINVQVDLMQNANSEKVRSDAANSILTHLKQPETKNIDLKISTDESQGMKEMKGMLRQVVAKQMEVIADGAKAKDIADQDIADAEFVEVEDEG